MTQSNLASTTGRGNLARAIVGAALGAGIGLVGWLALEHYAGYAFGPAYFALLPGGLAGLLSVTLGQRPTGAAFAVPTVTLVAVLAGGYLSCWNAATLARADHDARAERSVAGYERLDTEQRDLVADKVAGARADGTALTPMSRLVSSWGIWYLLFGGISVWMAHFIVTGGSWPMSEENARGKADADSGNDAPA